MSNIKGSKSRINRDSNQEAEVKPQGLGAKADLLITIQKTKSLMFGADTMEEICKRNNLLEAIKRVRQNKGSPGVDGMTIDELPQYLKENWRKIKDQLLKGEYQSQPVKRVEIPKTGSKEKRKLGVPTVVDRFIQQATLQVLQKQWDKEFSEHSYGFRPGRRAHQAIAKAQSYVKDGYRYVVDIDLEKFFDRVNHDRLISRLTSRIGDRRVIKLVRSYLSAGILENGLVSTPKEGTPQGGPLSPFLSNIVLDELDKELELRGHCFVRYADDCNVYAKSRRAGERVMRSITQFIENRLRLKVNKAKSAVDIPQKRKFLGFTLTDGKNPNRRKIAPESIKRFKSRIRQLTRRNRNINPEDRIAKLSVFLTGWRGYFGYCETPSVLRDLDSWIRRRLRCIQWKQWKTYKRRKIKLKKLGINEDLAQTAAWSSKGPWRMSHTPATRIALNNKYFDALGLARLEMCHNI